MTAADKIIVNKIVLAHAASLKTLTYVGKKEYSMGICQGNKITTAVGMLVSVQGSQYLQFSLRGQKNPTERQHQQDYKIIRDAKKISGYLDELACCWFLFLFGQVLLQCVNRLLVPFPVPALSTPSQRQHTA
jgi:hypothetical protein